MKPIALLLLFTASLARVDVTADLARLPGNDATAAAKIAERLLKQGAPAVKEICALLAPIGSKDDTAARYAVTAMIHAAAKDPATRTMLATALADFLTTDADPEIKTFITTQLQLIAGDESVPALAKLLGDENLCDPAAMALERIASPAAVTALMKALENPKPGKASALIKALGQLRATHANAMIRDYFTSTDKVARETAFWAAANIGDQQTGEEIRIYAVKAKPEERGRIWSWFVLWCDRLGTGGRPHESAQACLFIAQAMPRDKIDIHSIGALLRTAVKYDSQMSMKYLSAHAMSDDIELRSAALDAAATMQGKTYEGESYTDAWVNVLRKTPSPAARADIAHMLARRGDKDALDALISTVKDSDPTVRAAAATAAVKLGGEEAILSLIALLKSRDASDIKTAADLLARMPGEKALAAMAGAMNEFPNAGKVAVIETLAARSAKAHLSSVGTGLKDQDAAVRLAAIKAFERLGSPADITPLLELAIESRSKADESAAIASATALAMQIQDTDQRAQLFITGMGRASGEKRAALLRSLARLGGPKSLAAVAADLKSEDKTVKDASLRALADWPDDSAVTPLLEVAQSDAPLAQQVIALRGATNVLKNSKSPSAQKVKLYGQALAAAKRPDEKKLVLAALSAERSAESLDLAASLLSDESLKPEAALAVIRIAAPLERGQKGLTSSKAIEALQAAIPLCPDAGAKSAAEKHLASLQRK